jgi:hypothetical protein
MSNQRVPSAGVFTYNAMNALNSLLASLGIVTQGNVFWVKPRTGTDTLQGNAGQTPDAAWKTLTFALAQCTANQNDVVVLCAEGNTAANTTDYQSTTLTWAKDMVHLIGLNAGGPYNKRSRVAWAAAAASASDIPLFDLSANGCLIANVSFPVGSTDANLSFGVKVTGDRNRFVNVDIPWPTNDANDVAGAYALKLDGCDETSFENCTFGSFTIGAGGGANSTVLIDTGCSMVKFVDCDFIQRIESTTNTPAVKTADANSLGFGCVWFKRCNFIFDSIGGAVAAAAAMTITAAQVDGRIVLADCHTNAAKWDNNDANMILNGCVGIPIGDTAGVTLAV